MLTFQELSLRLTEFWNPLVERCGVITPNGVIELQNNHPQPDLGFRISKTDFPEDTSATWHTHPSGMANLSTPDYCLFLLLPDLDHYIVAENVVWKYYVKDNKVFLQ